jgi:hypothetical protein
MTSSSIPFIPHPIYLLFLHASPSFLDLVFMIEERWLPGSRQQSLPILLIGPETILISADHLLDRHHSHSILEMSYGEVGVAAHQPLDAAESYLAESGKGYQQSLVSKELAGTVRTAFWESKM